MKYFFNTIKSLSYWKYIFSLNGFKLIFAFYGAIWLFLESLDFFKIYTKDEYAPYAFILFLLMSVFLSILFRRPIKSIVISFKQHDFNLEVRITDIFEVQGAIVISSNTVFEADVANGKIARDSLQGQFTALYFAGDQDKLINEIDDYLKNINEISPYPMGTVVPIKTHSKTFYFLAMATLGKDGNASSTQEDIKLSLDALWDHVRNKGELQDLVLPLLGTGRGRIKLSRKKMITLMAESYIKASNENKITEKLIITVTQEDAKNFGVNLYDIKDHLNHELN